MARVFVSHASEDRELASELRGWLIEEGHEVFLDQHLRDGIGLGEEWEQRLYERLRWADAVLCTVTSAFVASSWCMAEIAIARSQGSRLLPVQVEPGVQHPLLRSVQHANYSRDKRRAQHQVRTALRRLDSAGRRGWSDEDIPFPGLLPVTLHQAFFGRKVQVEQLAELLRTFATRGERRLVLVVGPSGCGKSSLVRAGLKPIMAAEDDWHVIPTFVPGRDPAQALVREFAAASQELHLGWTLDHVREQLGRKDGIVALADGLLLAAHRRHLLLTVDQFEEVLTQADRESWAHFAAMLAEAQRGPIQAVATLRPESLLWNLTDPDAPVRLTTMVGHTDSVLAATFSPDGRILATAGADRTAILWDLTDRASPTRLVTVAGHTDSIQTVRVAPDDRSLVTSSTDQTTILWDVGDATYTARHAGALACALAGPSLSREDWARYVRTLPYERICP